MQKFLFLFSLPHAVPLLYHISRGAFQVFGEPSSLNFLNASTETHSRSKAGKKYSGFNRLLPYILAFAD